MGLKRSYKSELRKHATDWELNIHIVLLKQAYHSIGDWWSAWGDNYKTIYVYLTVDGTLDQPWDPIDHN